MQLVIVVVSMCYKRTFHDENPDISRLDKFTDLKRHQIIDNLLDMTEG